ncbi:L,D-transpeptidase [bacterium]|jgi:hypothetical protein|nr:L,D-transpeptidase [Verrucomicrobiales bacterium]MDB2346277.1 L,D-transpeptidase [Verrucomicrobiales bacterium]MDB4468084.1 L,D-transpeptidase [Verrucomicrobiales bacterium]MDB4789464.1 L,D-transpeptidase [Verrucomicrobiales bacterium]MDC3255175.1 L,D-transpeptidase [bacterium]
MKSLLYITFSVLALFSVSCETNKSYKKKKANSGLSTGYPTPGFDSSYYVKAYRPTNPANVRVKVSTSNQSVYVMEGNKPLMVLACTVGKASSPTPKGHLRIRSKQKYRRRQSQPGRGYPMGYWCEFKSAAYGIHAGWVHNAPRSAGCIRLHFNAAPKFFNLVRVGTPLHIATVHPEDATIGQNILRPRDAAAPEFPPSIQNTNEVFHIYKGPLFDD